MAAFVLAVAWSMTQVAPARATGGEGEAWPNFTESSSCGAQRVPTPLALRPGGFRLETLLRGPFANMFGRSVEDLRSDLVRWTIPGSNKVLLAHERMIPALDRVDSTIEAAIARGRTYGIRSNTTSATAARTIAGEVRISRHTFGTAFDINTHANPYREDNELITDMPEWWVEAFLDAGFCWGGLWIGSKDSMHLAWQGPAFSRYDTLPLPYEPLTKPARLGQRANTVTVIPDELDGTYATLLVDADGNGAADVVRLVEGPDGLIVDVSVASRGHNACSARRSVVAGLGSLPARALATGFGDWDGRGGQDLWLMTDEDGLLRLTVRWAFGGYSAETAVTTEVPTPSASSWVSTGDFDVDGSLDLFVIDDDELSVWAVDPDTGTTSLLHRTSNPHPRAEHHMLGDADLDNRPDLWSIDGDTVIVATAASGYRTSTSHGRPAGLPGRILDAVASDYDGDGRTDLVVFDGRTKQVWLANTPLPDGLPFETWFEYPDSECEEGEPTWDRQELRFSTSEWIAVGSYEWRDKHGFETGCDPSEDDCEPPDVTGTSFAEFLAWIDGLDPGSDKEGFAAVKAVEEANYVFPCSSRDQACLGSRLLRAQVSTYFGQFLADRRGDVPQPHRWVLPKPAPSSAMSEPR